MGQKLGSNNDNKKTKKLRNRWRLKKKHDLMLCCAI
jgi:hypothetical protein